MKISTLRSRFISIGTKLILSLLLVYNSSCDTTEKAELVLVNGRLYTLSWPDPATDGTPDQDAPFSEDGWKPEAEAMAMSNGQIVFVGSNQEIETYIGNETQVIDVNGGTIIPGLVDAHTHVEALGQKLDMVDLNNVKTEEEAVDLVVARAQNVPAGEWIVGRGWDEGAWADNYPDMNLLTERVPDHPVLLIGLHTFAAWCNLKALQEAGITPDTPNPVGGEIVKDQEGIPNGLFLNNATDLLEVAIPAPDLEKTKSYLMDGLNEMAKSGYVAVHNAGIDSELMEALFELDNDSELQVRVYGMVSASDTVLMRQWEKRGPYTSESGMLVICGVKAFYDGALGSRGAKLLEDYLDKPGHRGFSGEDYGFDEQILFDLAKAGFQLSIHAIGDAGNRETIDFFEKLYSIDPTTNALRHRIEHAQVIHPDDFSRLVNNKLIASMQPGHAAEDKTWAEERIGPDRIKGAYAWRTCRELEVPLIFGSDLIGSDHNIFYGLHSAITRRSKDLLPEGGWYIEEALTPEESLRAFTNWAAFGAFMEKETGVLVKGKWGDVTVLDLDPLEIGSTDPSKLFDGSVLLTVVNGQVIYQNNTLAAGNE